MSSDENNEIELFVHGRGEPLRTVTVPSTATVAELATKIGDLAPHISAPDSDEPLEAGLTVAEAGLATGGHVFAGTCRRISVSVRYSGETIEDEFPPGTAIAAVFAWATGPKGHDLAPSERAKHLLAKCGTDEQADKNAHVGEFAGEDCSVCFDLTPKERFEG
jgi:hypothetical protein